MTPSNRSGIALGVAVVLMAVVFVVTFGYFTLMRGVGSGLEGADGHIRSLAIAEAGAHALIARVFSKPWETRWFKQRPEIADSPVVYGGGSYISVIQDTPGVPLSFDIWVRSEYRGTRRLLFYRITYEDSVFHGLVTPTVDFTSVLGEGSSAPPLSGADLDPLTRQVNGWIEQRKLTSGDLGETRQRLLTKVDPLSILRELGAVTTSGATAAVATGVPGVSTAVSPPPIAPIPAGGKNTVGDVDRKRVFDWLDKRGYYSEYLAVLKGTADREFRKIEAATKTGRFLEAETLLRKLMEYIYGRTGAVNTQVNVQRASYVEARQALETRALAEAWPPEQLAAARLALERDYQTRIQQVYQSGWSAY